MLSQHLSVRDRVLAIDALEKLAREINLISAWLAEAGAEVEADAANDAAKSLLACCWWLDRPLRVQLPPTRWPQQPTCEVGMSQPGAELR